MVLEYTGLPCVKGFFGPCYLHPDLAEAALFFSGRISLDCQSAAKLRRSDRCNFFIDDIITTNNCPVLTEIKG